MIQEEIDQKIKGLIETKVEEAYKRMNSFSKLKSVFENLTKKGYAEEMRWFRDVVFATTLYHPDWTEEDILMEFLNKMDY